MSKLRTIDVHTHVLTEETMKLLGKESEKAKTTVAAMDKDFATLDVAGTVYKPFPTGGFDIERRLKDMDASQVDVQVLSATPQTYLYNVEPSLGVTTAQIQNDGMAKIVREQPDRFMAIATLPMQDPEKAAAELRRVMTQLGMRGTMFASNIMGKNLDDPSFEPVWKTAEELNAFVFIHPNNIAGADRMKSYYLNNLIGNPLDTTIGAACLIFGGVMDRYPKLRVCLAHGGGFVPYQAGRWTHGWKVRPEPQKNIKKAPEEIVRRFMYDTICHSPQVLKFLIERAGVDRVLMGSDYPYDMGMLECVRDVRALKLPQGDTDAIISTRAEQLMQEAKH